MPQLSTNTVGKANVAGTRFENISNPYDSMPRQRTNWDKFVNWLGFRSGYDKAQEQYNLAGAEYNAQLEQLASEEQYNSPIEQAQRMRQAGLNPDLIGVSGEPASEFDNQQQSPDINASPDFNPVDLIKDALPFVLSSISSTVGILNDVNLLKQNRIALDSKDLDFANKILGTVKSVDSYMRGPSDVSENGLDGSVISYNIGDRSPLFHSRRSARRFNTAYKKAQDTLFGLTNQYSSFDAYAKSVENYGKTMSAPYMSGLGSLSAQEVVSFLKPFTRAQFDLAFAQAKAANAEAYRDYHKAGYEGDAYGLLDRNEGANGPSQYSRDLAETISAETKARKSDADTRSSLNPLKITQAKIYKRLLDKIERIPDSSLGASILKYQLSSYLSQGLGISDVVSGVSSLSKLIP